MLSQKVYEKFIKELKETAEKIATEQYNIREAKIKAELEEK